MRDAALRYPNILFDLDGTLTDPREGITCSVQFALARLGIDDGPGAPGTLHRPPLLQCFMQTYGFDEARAWEAVNHSSASGSPVSREPRVRRHSRAARSPGRTRPHALRRDQQARRVRPRDRPPLAFDRHFKAIYGSELDGTRTHKDELIRHLLDSEGLAAEHCLMIGDRMHDLLGASRNGVACIGVGYGFGSEDELRAHQPTHYCADLAALRQVLESH